MPLGTPLKTFIYDIGEGGVGGRSIKSVQTGGPSGGCIPHEMFDTPVDYESLAQLGSIMGSGGMVVMDEDNCMVDVARYFVEFTNSESCGKCVPCRVGLNKSLRILNRITSGAGRMQHMETLDELSRYIRECSLCGLGQTAPNPVLTTMRHFRHEFEDHIVARRCQAGVCTELALSPCENSCPLHMNIPRFLQLYKESRLEEAFDSIILDNPLPSSTGRVCQHPCDERCRRQTMDDSVNMREVHRYIADAVLLSDRFDAAVERVAKRMLEHTGRKIAIAGAGPTGLTAAFYLALLGHDVTVFDPLPEPGGMLRFALPEYRLPKPVLRREIELIERLGVKFTLNTRVGTDITLNELDERFDAVFLAIGTWKESWVYLPGTELKGVYPALPSAGVDCKRRLGEPWAQGGGDRRRQRSHRFGTLFVAQGSGGHRGLSPRAQGHARDRRRNRSRREGRRAHRFPLRAAPHHRRRQGQRQSAGSGQDPAGRIRHFGTAQAGPHRRGPAHRM